MKQRPVRIALLLATCLLAGVATTAQTTPHATGIEGGVVYLNDLEPHTWSYYTAESPIHSLNPVDAHITYYGNGTGTVATTDDASPTTFGADAEGVKVGYDAPESTFVYYKTLERMGPADGTGRAVDRTIPNPFSVRPTYGSGDNRWRGFYRWRVKSTPTGGSVYPTATGGTALAKGDEVDAETDLYFELSEGSTSITLELEALWARAYVTTGTSSLSTTAGSYERNFHVITSTSATTASNLQKPYPLTISALYPNGTTDGTTEATAVPTNVRVRGDFTAAANTKFEYICIDAATTTYSADAHDLAFGRNILPYGTNTVCINSIRGTETGSTTTTILRTYGSYTYYAKGYTNDINYSMRIESGSINYLSFLRGYPTASSYNDTVGIQGTGTTRYYYSFLGNNNSIRITIGNDYDRAHNDNSQITINQFCCVGYLQGYQQANTLFPNQDAQQEVVNLTVKSGKIMPNIEIGDGSATRSLYFSVGYNNLFKGHRTLTIEGGELPTIAGGQDVQCDAANESLLVRIKGSPTIRGALYGGAAYAATKGHRRYVITGGTIKGWIAGGCNGTTATQNVDGTLPSNTFIYIGGNATVGDSSGGALTINASAGGNVFGAGSGNSLVNTGTDEEKTRYATAGQVDNSTVVIADNAYVQNNVYGGGNFGYVKDGGLADVRILGGTVKGKVFGGANRRKGAQVSLTMTGGTVEGGVYGGSNDAGEVAGPVKVCIYGGTVGTGAITDPKSSETGHVFGSGYGKETHVMGNVEVIIGSPTGRDIHADSPLIYGNVYGGGHLASYTQTGHTFRVLGQNGKVMGSIFGGGKGSENDPGAAMIEGNTDVLLRGSIEVMGNVYGGGHLGKVTGDTSVKIQK